MIYKKKFFRHHYCVAACNEVFIDVLGVSIFSRAEKDVKDEFDDESDERDCSDLL